MVSAHHSEVSSFLGAGDDKAALIGSARQPRHGEAVAFFRPRKRSVASDLDRVCCVDFKLLLAPLVQLLSGDGWASFHQTADESVEDEASVASVSTVEAKDELIEIGVQVLVAHRSLMGAEQPAL